VKKLKIVESFQKPKGVAAADKDRVSLLHGLTRVNGTSKSPLYNYWA